MALYVTDMATKIRPSTLTRRMAAISVTHQRAGFPSPTVDPQVREIVRGIRRTVGVAPREAAPAVLAEIRRMVALLPEGPLGIRDRALLLVGFAGALRRSELVALDVADLERREEGLVVTLRASKTDQERRGRQVALPVGHDPYSCPVRAVEAWLEVAGIEEGPVFRPVDRHGRVGPDRLSDKAVSLVVKRSAAAAGLDPNRYSGHSLRAGFATTAAAAGASERAIANQTGHRSMDVLRRYIRGGSIFTDNAVSALGL